jgi:hypothetical protein
MSNRRVLRNRLSWRLLSDALFINDAFRDQMFDAPRLNRPAFFAPLQISGIYKFFAVAGRAAKIRLQNRIPRFAQNCA